MTQEQLEAMRAQSYATNRKRFEYKSLLLNGALSENDLTKLGLEGWELCIVNHRVYMDNDERISENLWIFKREIL